MTRIKNVSLAGEQLVTQYGTYVFDANGTVEVPDELAQKLVTIAGFTIIGKVDDDTVPSSSVTLDSGVVWQKIDGGYIVTSDAITFTVTGSGVDSDTIPPANVTLQNGVLAFGDNTDVANVHVKGVAEGETILIGENTYKWWDVDGNLENGYELKIVPPPVTLPGGGIYTPIDGGYVLEGDNNANFTVTGDYLDTEHLSIQNGKLIISEGADIDNLVVIGVTENDTISIGDDIYKWVAVDDADPDKGCKLEYVEEYFDLANGGQYTITDTGFILTDGDSSYTLTSSLIDSNHIAIQNGKLVLLPGIDTSLLHVQGVTENDTIQIGDDTYIWKDTNANINGYELMLIPKTDWTKTETNIIYHGTDANYTIYGSALGFDILNNVPINASVIGGKLQFDSNIDIANLHVLGVTPDDSIQIGEDTYKWINVDDNLENGYELKFVPPTEPLPSGGSYYTVEGGYVLSDTTNAAFTLTGDSFDTDRIGVANGKLILQEGVDTTNLHVLGVTEGDSIQVGNNVYKWENTDNISGNGYELSLVSKDGWHTVEGGYVYDKDGAAYTLLGSAFSSSDLIPSNVSITNGEISLSPEIDTSSVHVIGVNENDSIQIGSNTYIWKNTDADALGYELEYVQQSVELPNGGSYLTVEGGFVLTDGEGEFTVTGSSLDTEHISIQNGKLVLSDGIDTANVHVIGVEENTTVQIGADTYKWVNSDDNSENGYELEYVPEVYTLAGGGSYTTLAGGGYELFDDSASYSILSSGIDEEHISIQNGKLVLSDGIDVSNLHVLGVTPDDSIQIGEDTYKWVNVDGNLENGYELEYIQKPIDLPNGGSYTTVEGGFVLTDGTGEFTVTGNNLDTDHIGITDGAITVLPGADLSSVHVLGVNAGDSIQVGDDTYRWVDLDNAPENGYELKLVPNTGWKMDNNTLLYDDGNVAYTITGPEFGYNDDLNVPIGVTVDGGNLEFDPNLNTLNIHVKGVEENSIIQIGNDYYKWTNADGDITTGLELALLEVPEGFEYDFDGKKFTVEGGIGSEITLEQLNQGVHFDENGKLIIGKDIVSSIEGVHIQGLSSGDTVNIAGEDYTLMDTDNDLKNGYELVGGTDDAFDWRWSNRSRKAEPQIWRHYTDSSADIKVQGVSARPTYNLRANTVTLIGSEISSITNSTAANLKLAGDVTGVLSPGSVFSTKNGLVDVTSGSYVYMEDVLYVPSGSITGISGNLAFTLEDKKLVITSGKLDVDRATVQGTAIATVTYSNNNFLVSGNKLLKNAFSKRRAIR